MTRGEEIEAAARALIDEYDQARREAYRLATMMGVISGTEAKVRAEYDPPAMSRLRFLLRPPPEVERGKCGECGHEPHQGRECFAIKVTPDEKWDGLCKCGPSTKDGSCPPCEVCEVKFVWPGRDPACPKCGTGRDGCDHPGPLDALVGSREDAVKRHAAGQAVAR